MSNTTKLVDIPYALLEVFSQKIIRELTPKLYFMNLVDHKMALGSEKGERVRFMVQNWLPSADPILDEETPISIEKMSGSEKYITLKEMAGGVSISRMCVESAHVNILQEASLLIQQQAAEAIDLYIRNTFLSTANKYYTRADSTSGVAVNETAAPMSANLIAALKEKASEMRMPKFKGKLMEYYVMVCDARVIRQLRMEIGQNSWREFQYSYEGSGDILYGTVGMYEGILFVEAPQMSDLRLVGAGAAGANVRRSLFIGANSVGYVTSVPMGLHQLNELEPFRKTSLAWYSIAGAGILQDNIMEVYTTE